MVVQEVLLWACECREVVVASHQTPLLYCFLELACLWMDHTLPHLMEVCTQPEACLVGCSVLGCAAQAVKVEEPSTDPTPQAHLQEETLHSLCH